VNRAPALAHQLGALGPSRPASALLEVAEQTSL